MRPLHRLLIALLVAAGATADTEEQAADRVLAAWKAKNEDAVRALAARDEPDPWLVAHELCFRGEHDAAEAFARAAPRWAVEKLPAYVAGRRDTEPDRDAHEAFAEMKAALQHGDWNRGLKAVADLAEPADPVARIQIAYGRGFALSRLRKRAESDRALRGLAEAAESLG